MKKMIINIGIKQGDKVSEQSSTSGTQTQPRKRQINLIRPAQMSLFARVRSYPPLGQVTTVKKGEGKVSLHIHITPSG